MSDGRVTVVTGGASERGLATARRFDALAGTIDADAASPQDR
jgi:NAD(P)-dependent dehydrogenase (short-subunit alcohol dehydrogenase family)